MRRRRFLGLCAAGGAALAVPACRAAAPSPLAALVDAILPAGLGLPGGLEAGVPAYLERTLAEPRFAGVAGAIRDGLAALEARHGRLARLDPAARLRAFTGGDELFVNAFLDFTLEGYLGRPGGAVWAALALP